LRRRHSLSLLNVAGAIEARVGVSSAMTGGRSGKCGLFEETGKSAPRNARRHGQPMCVREVPGLKFPPVQSNALMPMA